VLASATVIADGWLIGLVPGLHIRQAPARRPGLPQVAPATPITRICMIASLSKLDGIAVQIGGSARAMSQKSH